jgi:hypothetical protein
MQMRFLNSIILLFFVSCKFPAGSETTTLDLSNQNLTTIPDSVFSLKKLEYLNLGNSFTMYPPLSALHQEGPSGDRMNKLNLMWVNVGQGANNNAGFANNYYWSSTDEGTGKVGSQNFSDGTQNLGASGKNNQIYVLTIKLFMFTAKWSIV